MRTIDEVLSHVDKDERGCWIWTAYVHPSGYGRFSWEGAKQYAHRVVFTELRGPIPDGQDLDHLCRVRSCVNPDHLEAVTRSENVRRGVGWHKIANINAVKDACKNGHPYDESNTYTTKQGWRSCRECHREWSREWKRRRSA